jgi:enoyl-CoA hydratase/carnithine racemase
VKRREEVTVSTPAGGEVIRRVDGPTATLTLSRPAKRNSVTRAMWRQLTDLVRDLGADPTIRVIVIRGHGTVFSSGADLPEVVAAASAESAQVFCDEVAQALHMLATTPKLTIALLAHHVSGGGAEIALACDLRIAQEDVEVSVPVARLGLVPDRVTVRRLLALAGPGVTREVLLLARKLDAAHSLRVGLVDRVVDVGALDDALADVLSDVAQTVDYSLVHIKALLLNEEALGGPDHLVDEFVQSMIHGGVADNGRRYFAGLG